MFEKIKTYVKESFNELFHKVSWPTWQELQSSAMVVCIASLIVAVLVYLMDVASSTILTNFYKMF